jgi:hypothetical protein
LNYLYKLAALRPDRKKKELCPIDDIVCRFSTTANLPPSSINLSRIIKGVNRIQ